jgi:nucleotide-binding universal stress UspA family protein
MKKLNIQRILIPMDFSETGLLALEHGAFMARLFKADIYLLHVIELLEYSFATYDPLATVDTGEMETVVTKNLNDLAQKISSQYGIQVIPIISSGRVSSEVKDVASDNEIDIIIMGTHGVKGVSEFFIGSNAHRTATVSSCPVITVQTHAQNIGFTNIVMPIDSTIHSRQKVDHVIELASKYAAKVHILGLVNTSENADENKLNIKIDAVEKAIKKAGLSYERHTTKGKNLAIETMNYADKVKSDLIVIMTDHESDLNGMFMGAFAKQIINHSLVPIMSIKPIEGKYDPLDLSASSNPFG